LKEYFDTYPEDLDIGKIRADLKLLDQRLLNYRRPYRIAVIGVSGAGKSLLTNALLGQDYGYSPTAELGGAATGAAIHFVFDSAKAHRAEITYHTPASIYKLAQDYLLTLDELKGVELSSEIEQLAPQLRNFNTSSTGKDGIDRTSRCLPRSPTPLQEESAANLLGSPRPAPASQVSSPRDAGSGERDSHSVDCRGDVLRAGCRHRRPAGAGEFAAKL